MKLPDGKKKLSSFPRKRESKLILVEKEKWIPACAGMTAEKRGIA
jgi:hypothetical protein